MYPEQICKFAAVKKKFPADSGLTVVLDLSTASTRPSVRSESWKRPFAGRKGAGTRCLSFPSQDADQGVNGGSAIHSKTGQAGAS